MKYLLKAYRYNSSGQETVRYEMGHSNLKSLRENLESISDEFENYEIYKGDELFDRNFIKGIEDTD